MMPCRVSNAGYVRGVPLCLRLMIAEAQRRGIKVKVVLNGLLSTPASDVAQLGSGNGLVSL
ncbi:MAG TPA: hypothetical protein VJQ54_12175 [Candidatus Sulfotelmatobacter sp.]|nr:hypothetical protein [Candidatus Sulfotelmatobacter sp.]